MKLPEDWSTERLLLRQLSINDADGPYAMWVLDPEVTRYLEIRFNPPDTKQLRKYIQEMNLSADNLVVGLERKDTGMHIGNIRVGPIDKWHLRAAVGLMLGDRGSWGKGFASEAIAAVTDFAFNVLELEKLYAGLYSPNKGSEKAFRNAGYHVEAVRRAHAVLDGDRIDVIEMAKFRS
ncbi:GNAT family N-acetyltransferase [Roseobacter sp. HKCCD7870]|uniref:GNAT family N-acetyltransferase n=1 Tax=Roseobacter sp. HKCCD7870 TaxID=3120343 RepID=UPI0030EEA439